MFCIKAACNGARAAKIVKMPVLNEPHVMYCFEFSDADNNVKKRRGITCRDLKEAMLRTGFRIGDYLAEFPFQFTCARYNRLKFWKTSMSESDMSCDYVSDSVGDCDCVARDLRLFVVDVTNSSSVDIFDTHGLIDESALVLNLQRYREVRCTFFHCPTSSCKRNQNYL